MLIVKINFQQNLAWKFGYAICAEKHVNVLVNNPSFWNSHEIVYN